MDVKNAKLPPFNRHTAITVRILAVLSGVIVAASLALWISWIQKIEAESGYHTARALLYLSSISFGILGAILAAVGILLSRCRSPWPWLMLIANCLVAVIIFRYSTWPRAPEVMRAVKERDVAKIEQYARLGVDLNAPSYWGWSHSKGRTPLTQAVEYGDAAMVRALLESGALVNRVDGHGDAPLNVAVLISRIDIIDLLLKHRRISTRVHYHLGPP
jgi:MFS family permease